MSGNPSEAFEEFQSKGHFISKISRKSLRSFWTISLTFHRNLCDWSIAARNTGNCFPSLLKKTSWNFWRITGVSQLYLWRIRLDKNFQSFGRMYLKLLEKQKDLSGVHFEVCGKSLWSSCGIVLKISQELLENLRSCRSLWRVPLEFTNSFLKV